MNIIIYFITSIIMFIIDVIFIVNQKKYHYLFLYWMIVLAILSGIFWSISTINKSVYVKKKFPKIYMENLIKYRSDWHGDPIFDFKSNKLNEPEIVTIRNKLNEFRNTSMISILLIIFYVVMIYIVKFV